MSTAAPLPYAPVPPTHEELALTQRFLTPARDAVEAFLLQVRAGTDAALLGSGALVRRARAYPVGYCLEIADHVYAALPGHLARPAHPGAAALRGFLDAGGTGRRVWGALRGQYFQNAMQFGGLYVDVANDTVTETKPKVEILPMEASGLEAIRGPAHFADVAWRYWGMHVFANHAVPSLAPLFPMMGWIPGVRPRLLSANDYMTALMRRDGFVQAEAWISQGPAAPPELLAAQRALCPEEVRAADPAPGRDASLEACRRARDAGKAEDPAWVRACQAALRRIAV